MATLHFIFVYRKEKGHLHSSFIVDGVVVLQPSNVVWWDYDDGEYTNLHYNEKRKLFMETVNDEYNIPPKYSDYHFDLSIAAALAPGPTNSNMCTNGMINYWDWERQHQCC